MSTITAPAVKTLPAHDVTLNPDAETTQVGYQACPTAGPQTDDFKPEWEPEKYWDSSNDFQSEGYPDKYRDLWNENMPRVSGSMYFAIPGEQPIHVTDEQARRILVMLSVEAN